MSNIRTMLVMSVMWVLHFDWLAIINTDIVGHITYSSHLMSYAGINC